ncbi:unnamed protein product, partial [Sphacelaria rigidula]
GKHKLLRSGRQTVIMWSRHVFLSCAGCAFVRVILSTTTNDTRSNHTPHPTRDGARFARTRQKTTRLARRSRRHVMHTVAVWRVVLRSFDEDAEADDSGDSSAPPVKRRRWVYP